MTDFWNTTVLVFGSWSLWCDSAYNHEFLCKCEWKTQLTTVSIFWLICCFHLTSRATHHTPRLAPTLISVEMTDILRSMNKWSLNRGDWHPVWAGALQYFPLKGLSIWFIMVESVLALVPSLSLSHKVKYEYKKDQVTWILMCTSTVTLCIQMRAESICVHGHAFSLPVILNCCYEQQVLSYFPWVGVIMKHLPWVLCHRRGTAPAPNELFTEMENCFDNVFE